MLKFFRLILIMALIFTLAAPDAFAAKHKAKKKGPYRVTANSAILWDPSAGKSLYSLNPDKHVLPASTTKVLTALIVLEKLPLDEYVTVSARAPNVQPTKLDVRPGEQYLVRDLLYALLLKSANDAAVVLAEAVAGSEDKFVDMMNARAQELGATNTHFANSNGLPSRAVQYTTASDMALIFREAIKKDFFRNAITLKYQVLYSKGGRRHLLKTHNKALFLDWSSYVFGKTGYTINAQSCFVGYLPRGNKTLIVAVFGCRKRWTDIKYIIEHYGRVDL